MVHQEINEAFENYHFEYEKTPIELFINRPTRDELLRTPGLNPQLLNSQSNPVSTIFGCPVYVVDMDESFMWLSESDLSSLNKSRNTPLEENWDYIPVTRINRNKEKVQANIPRVIRDFEYPQT